MDLLVGASILVAVIILITGVLWLKDVSVSRKVVDYAVLFPNIGTLQVGDPVQINGVPNGAVKKISLRGLKVLVILEVDKSVKLTDSCRIMIQNIGLMGERGVGMQYSDAGTRIRPISGADTVFLNGTFDTGIAEAMGMLGSVLGEVEVLTSNLASILNQTVGDTSFIKLFRTIVARLDSISLEVDVLLRDNKAPVEKSIKNLEKLTEEARRLVERNSPVFDTMALNGKVLTERALGITDDVDSLTGAMQAILGRLQDNETTAGKLLNDGQLYEDVKKTIADLDTLVRNVQDDALKLRIKLGFGKKRN